jgi:hypothetical protein
VSRSTYRNKYGPATSAAYLGGIDFLSKLLQGLSFIPAVVNGIEGLLGNRSGEEKKTAALSFLEATLSISEALGNRQITDETKFREGLAKIVDGAVECLNASAWAHEAGASAAK